MDECHQVADKYIEYDPVIVMIDLVLLNEQAYRHILYNSLFQIFDILVQRRGDAETKLHHPRVLEVENKYRSDLRMLRSMVGREYCILLLGSGNLFCFHHMANRQHTSAGERDTRLFELLYRLSARVVWIALRRRFSNLIEEELNRLFRTDVFNLMRRQIHRFSTAGLATSHENSILHGTGLDKAVLLGESPACLELLREKDYRMLGIGYVNFETKDPRMKFFEMLYDSPEEDLVHKGITIGILGLPRVDFDIMLAEKQTTMLHSSDVSLTTIASYLHSKVTVTSHAKKHPFTIPDLGEEEPVPDKFPCDNIPSSPDINLLERIDAKHIWKMNKTHPPMY
ncbi:protein phosphatase 1 regulatory subunit 36-like isoform X2 [Periplaneta americana]|uniref:protein phosphatase 1 regulatory subunit 36-like isoform X2 n=1 Tax=Periplaneta americana TaxID=6978 RepID=UPI0037E75B96